MFGIFKSCLNYLIGQLLFLFDWLSRLYPYLLFGYWSNTRKFGIHDEGSQTHIHLKKRWFGCSVICVGFKNPRLFGQPSTWLFVFYMFIEHFNIYKFEFLKKLNYLENYDELFYNLIKLLILNSVFFTK